MTEQEKKNALSLIWDVLHNHGGFEDKEWDESTGAMAEITEELGLDSGQPHD